MKNKVEFYSIIPEKIKSDLNISVSEDNRNIIQKSERPFFSHINLTPTFSALIPIRTNLNHKFGYLTKWTKEGKSGLDYTKAYIVETKNLSLYLDQRKIIDRKEYDKVSENYEVIKEEFKNFLIYFDEKFNMYGDLKHSEKILIDFSALQYQKENLSLCIDELKKTKQN